MIAFVDEAANPLPAGIRVTVALAAAPFTVVGTAFTAAGGTAVISVTNGTAYSATFFGAQAPRASQAFTGTTGTTSVTVGGYRSPSLSQAGYALEQTNLWPTGPGWFSDAARAPGGNAYAVAYGLAAVSALLDGEVQSVLQMLRLQSSAGADIDSWASDYLGATIFRYASETDSAFATRIIATLSRKPATLATLQAVVNEFFAAYPDLATSHIVFDTQSDPVHAGFYGIVRGQVAIASFYPVQSGAQSWPLGQHYLGQDTVLANAYGYTKSSASPYPILNSMVDATKAEGVEPVFISAVGLLPNQFTLDGSLLDGGDILA